MKSGDKRFIKSSRTERLCLLKCVKDDKGKVNKNQMLQESAEDVWTYRFENGVVES